MIIDVTSNVELVTLYPAARRRIALQMLGGPRGQASELRPRSIRTSERSLCRVPRRIHPTKFTVNSDFSDFLSTFP
jgi:hypothetical protein